MAISEITAKTLGKKKSGWRWDKKRELFVSFIVDTTFDGKRHVKRGFLTEKDAKDYIEQVKVQNRLKQIGVAAPVKFPTVKDLFDKRLADIENINERVRATRVFKKFLKLCGGKTTIDKITKNDYKKFADLRLAELSAKTKSDERIASHKKTVNREVNPIAKAFTSVRDYYNLKWIKPEVFKFSVSAGGRERLIEQREYDSLIGYLLAPANEMLPPKTDLARRRTGLILQFALMTGLRHGEICAVEKIKFNRMRRQVDVYRFKTKRWKMYSPLTDTMIALLETGAKLYPAGNYFFSDKGKLQAGFYKQIRLACEKLEIPYGKFTEGGFVLHDARHTFSTILHHNLIDNKTSVEFTDNPSAIGNYQHASIESKKRAMDVIERLFGGDVREDESKFDNLFDAIKSGEMTRDEFRGKIKKLLESFSGFFAKKSLFDVQNVQDVQDTKTDFVQ